MVIDRQGFRLNVGIVLINESNHVFFARRVGQSAWQFPQGGMMAEETVKEAMYRELSEEIGLERGDVEVLGCTRGWLHYRLPHKFIRRHTTPKVIGQKQKWFLLRLTTSDQKIKLDCGPTPEFDSWRWVDFNYPAEHVVYFKRKVYRRALKELANLLPNKNAQ